MQRFRDNILIMGSNGLIPYSGSTVAVYMAGTSTLASIYPSNDPASAKENPFRAGDYGEIDFYAQNGRYDLLLSRQGYQSLRITDLQIWDPANSDFVTDVDVDGMIAGKADKTYVDEELAEKADADATALALSEKVNTLDLADATDPDKGAGQVGYDGVTAQDVLDEARPMQSYAELRSYSGRAKGIRVTSRLIEGFFQRDDSDSTTADNGGTVLVDNAGRRWKRLHDGVLKVEWFGATPDNPSDDSTQAIRSAFDVAIALARARVSGGIRVEFGPGNFYVSDELLSDSFQEQWFNKTNLFKNKYIEVVGAGPGVTIIRATFDSAVRNTINGNQRTYGIWANQPSPAVLFPVITLGTAAPAAFFIKNIGLKGSGRIGRDPIPLLVASELDAQHHNVHVTGFDAPADVIWGSFNSTRISMHFESNGYQPVECGKFLDFPAGFLPSFVRFDLNGPSRTLTAKVTQPYGGYSAGDAVPFFQSHHVGKTVSIAYGASHGGVTQTLKGVIDTVGGDGTTATFTVIGSPTVRTLSTTPVSFLPVRYTSVATEPQIVLSAPVLIGRGAQDMIGMLVWLPKAGSTAASDYDILCTRIISCDEGDDVGGYTKVTLAVAPKNSATDWFITAPSHVTAADEAYNTSSPYEVNDTDFIGCRWEQSGGWGADLSAAAFIGIFQGHSGAVQYVSCKFHGGNTTQGQFSADGQFLFDDCVGVNFVGVGFTHCQDSGKGQLRFMGRRQIVTLTDCEPASWQLPSDYICMYIDPLDPVDLSTWSIEDYCGANVGRGSYSYPFGTQSRYGGATSLTPYQIESVFANPILKDATTARLRAVDDLNVVLIPGEYWWSSDAPANAPPNGPLSSMTVIGRPGSRKRQVVFDHDNRTTWERDYMTGTWGNWRTSGVRQYTTANLSAASNSANASLKYTGWVVFNTTEQKLMVSLGNDPTSNWSYCDGTGTITPS